MDAHYQDLMGTDGNIQMDRTLTNGKNLNVLEFSNTGINNVNSSKNLNSNFSRGNVDLNSNFSCEVGVSGLE